MNKVFLQSKFDLKSKSMTYKMRVISTIEANGRHLTPYLDQLIIADCTFDTPRKAER
jgi:hypothetical protein